MGIFEILTVIFITLKLIGSGAVAKWGWWKVFSPMWAGYPLLLLAVIICALFKK